MKLKAEFHIIELRSPLTLRVVRVRVTTMVRVMTVTRVLVRVSNSNKRASVYIYMSKFLYTLFEYLILLFLIY